MAGAPAYQAGPSGAGREVCGHAAAADGRARPGHAPVRSNGVTPTARAHDEGSRSRGLVGTVERLVTRTVAGLGRFLAGARDLRLGWAELPDFDLVYLWDAGDGGFGFAVNVDDHGISEWGYAPFAA